MKRDPLAKHLLIGLGLAALIYFLSFAVIQHLRERRGPWEVVFQTDEHGNPAIRVNQSELGIRDVRFMFPGTNLPQTNLNKRLRFDAPLTNTPFGTVVFIDNTFLPGTLTLHLFGHEIELLPRTLVVDKKEVEWSRSDAFELDAEGQPSLEHPPQR